MKTYVINSKKLIGRTVMAVAAAIAITVVFYFPIGGTVMRGIKSRSYNTERMLSYFPILCLKSEKKKPAGSSFFIEFLLNGALAEPEKVSLSAIPVLFSAGEKLSESIAGIDESNGVFPEIIKKTESEKIEDPIPENAYRALETHSDSIIKNGNELEKKGITVKNQTSCHPDLKKLYDEPVGIKYLNGEIQVLIVHTHGSEGYNPDDRSRDIQKNVVRVGSEMAEVFEKNKIGVIHSTVMHDIPRYNSSYKKSLETITAELEKHGGINIILDVHRDAMITENGDSYKTVCNLDGKTAAQVMFVVGTDGGGLTHDNWRENLKLAMKFQEAVNKRCPNLARPIDLRNERFNQQKTTGSLLIEVGTNGNTLDEAVRAGVAAAEAMAGVIKN